MCLDHEAVDDAQEIGADVETAACKYKDMKCAFYDNGCHYQAQKGLAKQVDVLLAAHEILFQVPAAFGKNFGLVIIDESFWQDGVRTEASLSIAHLADDLKEFPVRDYAGNKAHDDTEDLLLLIHRLQSAL